ncbi:MAG: hypothetical protein KF805_09265 [Phycisphaeraceae bacterium]|nr:hypothetical protein [Phycisphaeraceae bacterium]
MSAEQKTAVAQDNFRVGDSVESVNETLRKLDVEHEPIDQTFTKIKQEQSDRGGEAMVLAELSCRQPMLIQRPNLVIFYFDTQSQLTQVWIMDELPVLDSVEKVVSLSPAPRRLLPP